MDNEDNEGNKTLRKELIEMGVKFLSHPTVKTSPVLHQRSFLESKGLTHQEINEAFRLVQLHGAVTTSQSNQVANSQPQAAAQTLQPLLVTSTGVISAPPSQFYWSHLFWTLGVLGASGAGAYVLLKIFIFPRLKIWIRKPLFQENEKCAREDLREAIEAARTAAEAANNVTKASLAILDSKNDENRFFEDLVKHLQVQVGEMKVMNRSIWKLGETREILPSSRKVQHASWNERPLLASASVMSSTSQHLNSYMEFQDVNNSPPNPSQFRSAPRLPPRPKPWEAAQALNTSSYSPQPPVYNAVKMKDVKNTYQLSGENSVPWWRANVKSQNYNSENAVPNWLRRDTDYRIQT